MTEKSKFSEIRPPWLWAAAAAITLFLVTGVPYHYAIWHAPEGQHFIGQVAMSDDIATYFSFIHQAASGRWLFRNDMTYIPHTAAFFNIEFLALGKIMGILDLTSSVLFQVWRAIGALALLGGFTLLASTVHESGVRRGTAIVMCATGGGFGWFLYILSKFGAIDLSADLGLSNPAIDMITPLHAFGQVMKNPHFSLPHGTLLITIALFLLAERRSDYRLYLASGAMTTIHGLMRPYDLIPLWAVITLFVCVETWAARKIEVRKAFWRVVPLFFSAPPLLYQFVLFTFHPVFRYWSSQGGQVDLPIFWHMLSYGLAGVLFVLRLARCKREPLDAVQRFLAIWGISTFLLVHAYRFVPQLPYSPQFGVPLVTPLVLLAASNVPASLPAGRGRIVLAAFLAVNALTTPLYIKRACFDAAKRPQHYVTKDAVVATNWLRAQVQPDDVIVADFVLSGYLARELPSRVVTGHWALTPDAGRMRELANKATAGAMPAGELKEFLQTTGCKYVLISPVPDAFRKRHFLAARALTPVFERPDAVVLTFGGSYATLLQQAVIRQGATRAVPAVDVATLPWNLPSMDQSIADTTRNVHF